jgi:hypothetical protein
VWDRAAHGEHSDDDRDTSGGGGGDGDSDIRRRVAVGIADGHDYIEGQR